MFTRWCGLPPASRTSRMGAEKSRRGARFPWGLCCTDRHRGDL